MKTGPVALTPTSALSSFVWPRLRAVVGLSELLCKCALGALPLPLLSGHSDSVCTLVVLALFFAECSLHSHLLILNI